MCKYCRHLSTGNDWNPIKEVPINYGILGESELYAVIEKNHKGEPSIAVGIIACDNDVDFIEGHKKIKYCPMCGKKLKVEAW